MRRILLLVALFVCLGVSACDKREAGDAAVGASAAAAALPFPWAQAAAIALGVVGTALGGKAASFTMGKWTAEERSELLQSMTLDDTATLAAKFEAAGYELKKRA